MPALTTHSFTNSISGQNLASCATIVMLTDKSVEFFLSWPIFCHSILAWLVCARVKSNGACSSEGRRAKCLNVDFSYTKLIGYYLLPTVHIDIEEELFYWQLQVAFF